MVTRPLSRSGALAAYGGGQTLRRQQRPCWQRQPLPRRRWASPSLLVLRAGRREEASVADHAGADESGAGRYSSSLLLYALTSYVRAHTDKSDLLPPEALSGRPSRPQPCRMVVHKAGAMGMCEVSIGQLCVRCPKWVWWVS